MPSIELLHPTRNGQAVEHLENELRDLIILDKTEQFSVSRMRPQIASSQIHQGDHIRVSHEGRSAALVRAANEKPRSIRRWRERSIWIGVAGVEGKNLLC